jgi:hypothetical protein
LRVVPYIIARRYSHMSSVAPHDWASRWCSHETYRRLSGLHTARLLSGLYFAISERCRPDFQQNQAAAHFSDSYDTDPHQARVTSKPLHQVRIALDCASVRQNVGISNVPP